MSRDSGIIPPERPDARQLGWEEDIIMNIHGAYSHLAAIGA